MIPKIIHYAWFGGNEIPAEDQQCIESWRRLCPDYEIRLWNEQNYDITRCTYMREAYEHKMWGFVPDYLRLDVIYQCGGIYLDTDVELLKNLDPLLVNKAYCGLEKPLGKDKHTVNLGLGFGAEARNPVIKAMLDDYEGRHFIMDSGKLDLTPSPTLQTNTLKQFGFVKADILQNLGDIIVYSSEYFCPFNFFTGELLVTENTYGVHQYRASWVSPAEKEVINLKRVLSKHLKNEVLIKIISNWQAYRKYYGSGALLALLKKALVRVKHDG